MPSIINTNVNSLTAQRQLSVSQNSMATSMARLSSGLRINSAKDDAAGLAISERFTAQIRGVNQAGRNANDGISLAQTAEGDLAQISNNLQRIRELAVQSANSTNSASDRASLNNEAAALISENDRVASTSAFNGIKLLDGTFTAQNFQVGANGTSNDQISVTSIASARGNALGVGAASSFASAVTGSLITASTGIAAGDVQINGYQVGASVADGVSNNTSTSSGIAIAAAINAISGNTNVTATVRATAVAGTTVTGFATALTAGAVVINGVDIGAVAAATTAGGRGGQIAAAINAKTSQTGVTATFNSTTGAVALAAADGRNIDVTTNATSLAVNTGLGSGGAVTTVTRSGVNLSSAAQGGIAVSGLTANGLAASGLSEAATAATATAGAGVSSINLTTATGAQSALAAVDSAINTINSTRAALGAYQARFTSVVASLATTSENMTASRSRIQDADFAAETANLSRSQILQQAGTAMVAQANQLPQGVMALLRQ
jgi:flagellin